MRGSETHARVQALVGRGMLAVILLAPPVLLADEKFVTPTKSDVEGTWIVHRGTYSDRFDLFPNGTYTRLTLDGRDLGRAERGRWDFREQTDTAPPDRWPWLVVLRPEGNGGNQIHLSFDPHRNRLCVPLACYIREPYGVLWSMRGRAGRPPRGPGPGAAGMKGPQD